MICNWIIETMPTMVKFIGGMNAVEATAFSFGLLFAFYWLYVLFYTAFQTVRVNMQGTQKMKCVGQIKRHRTQKSKRTVNKVAFKRRYFEDDDRFDASWMDYEAWRATR